VLRDTRHYGFEFASYDLKRVIDNLIVVPGEGAHTLRLAVLPQGQSAVESFLLARFRMYQWGIRHHKVVQTAAALRKVIRDLLWAAMKGGRADDLNEFMLDLERIVKSANDPAFVDDNADVLQRFAWYDDIWWMTKMREAAVGHPDDPWLSLACFRRPGPVSLWKRVLDFPRDLETWNRDLPPYDDQAATGAWEEAREELERDDVLVVRHSFRPWEPADRTDPESDSALCLWNRDRGELIPLTAVSPIVKGLNGAWMADLQVHAFAAAAGDIAADAVIDRLPVATTV
jgi:HD superfamily phosphohydrolase